MDMVLSAALYTLTAFLLVWPLSVLVGAGRERTAVLVTAVGGAVAGILFAFVPASARLPMESVLIKGGTLWAGLCLLLAVLDVSGLGTLRRRYPVLHLGIILGLAATALPLSAISLVREARTAAFLKESALPWVYASAAALVAAAVCWLLVRFLARYDAQKYVTLWAYLLVAPVVRIAVQPSVVSNVEAVISRVAHDGMHVLIMLFEIPDHAYLSNIVWTLIALVFMKTTGMILNLAVYAGVVLYVVVKQASIPLPVRDGESPPERRRRWTRLRAKRRIVFAPVFVAMIAFAWFAYAGWASGGTPKTPTPVALPAGGIEVATLADGQLHSFSFGAKGDKRAIAILKSDGSYSVCLDACLICAPDGYAQLGSDLFCLYCGTPIPIGTVGQPGGCNPIPLEFAEKAGRLVFDTTKAEQMWEEANAGK